MKLAKFNISTRAILLFLLDVAMIAGLISLKLTLLGGTSSSLTTWFAGWLLNLSTDMFGAFATYILITIILGNREKAESELREYKERQIVAITELKASINIENRQLILDKMKKLDLFRAADLRNLNLEGANLEGANLLEVDFRGTNLVKSNLRGTNLTRANLQRAVMLFADIEGADLDYANLADAQLNNSILNNASLIHSVLENANLEKAKLLGANLQDAILNHAILTSANLHNASLKQATAKWAILTGAKLLGADLKEADLFSAKCDIYTQLPDGTQWSNEASLDRFTLKP